MRVILATDGSAQAQTSLDLVAGLAWPDDTLIRIVTVVEPYRSLYGAPWSPALPEHVDRLDSEMVAHGENILESAAQAAARTGRPVERSLVRGRPASSIVDEAVEWRADLVIVGSRGHGPLASMVLGSVGAEVADHAPCPVLIARRSSITRALLGHDGSPYATAAEQVIGRWPIFERVAIEVVSVAHVAAPWRSGGSPAGFAETMEAHAEVAEHGAPEHEHIAQESARRLREQGRDAAPVVVAGDAAASLVRVANDHHADLIVVGTHGRTGLTRILLGSVARNVMQHASCSVLVVRAAVSEEGTDRAIAAAMGAGPTD